MPSNSYMTFLDMRIDVSELINVHALFSDNTRGRKKLGFLTRSAVIMLCAAWERYNEDLLIESIDYLCLNINDVNLLNTEIKKNLSLNVRGDKDESKPLELAGDGWKQVWSGYAQVDTESLNTPKIEPLKKLFRKHLGILDYSRLLKSNSQNKINQFVSDRGEIAHNGRKAQYIRMTELKKYQELILSNVINIDSEMANQLQQMSGRNETPWTKEYWKDLSRYK